MVRGFATQFACLAAPVEYVGFVMVSVGLPSLALGCLLFSSSTRALKLSMETSKCIDSSPYVARFDGLLYVVNPGGQTWMPLARSSTFSMSFLSSMSADFVPENRIALQL